LLLKIFSFFKNSSIDYNIYLGFKLDGCGCEIRLNCTLIFQIILAIFTGSRCTVYPYLNI